MRIRQGNDFIFLWAIERNGEPENLDNAKNIKLHFKNFDCIGEVKSFQIVDGNIVRVEVSPEWASRLGAYRLILSYEFEDQSYSDGDRKCVVDVLAFNIVPKTSEADDVTKMAKTTDIMIGLKGDKGDPFTYEDFTPEQIEDLKRPAIEAAESVQIVENQISINEQGRVQAENERETAETTRISNENNRVTAEQARVDAENLRATAESSRQTAESLRVEAELLRQSSTQEAISNAENAAENANTAAQNADDARLAIQDDLALKADQADLVQLESDVSLLRDDATVKIENLVINGDFANGETGWTRHAVHSIPTFTQYADYINIVFSNKTVRSGLRSDVNTVIGNKYYCRFVFRGISNEELWTYNPNSTSTATGSWQTVSVLATADAETMAVGFRFIDQSGLTSQSIDVKGFTTIDLTQTFGDGNEPTKEEMDLLISILGIDYFEGEITIPAQKIMQWELAMIRQNRNAIIALGGTII